MSLLNHWQQQKETLRQALSQQTDLSGAVYQLRHALLQTEQNALAEMDDDVLRQQAGVLLSFLKTSLGLLETPFTSQTWVAKPVADKAIGKRRENWPLWLICVLANMLCGVLCYFAGSTLGWLASLLALGVSLYIFLRRMPSAVAAQDEVRVSIRPDPDRMIGLMDGQLRAADRALNDLEYLNDQLRGSADAGDTTVLSHVSDLMETLYEWDESMRLPVMEAAARLLDGMGLIVIEYSDETRKLFSALPSKTETRTLSPAILSKQDRKLLRRGTAVVKAHAA